MRVLVTGAAGFIGRHVTHALANAGHTVVGLDIHFEDGWGAADWVEADITQPLKPIPGLDAVIHLAAVSHPSDCDANPGKAFNVNVNGTHQVLKMALASGAKKVVFSSSAHVYDLPPKWLPTEETHPLRLNNVYTTTKILGEQLCDLYWTNHGLSYTVLRLFNAYGPGQGLGFFIPDMIAKANDGRISLSGGNTTKDWVFVNDVADAFVRALTTDFVGPINVGTGVETDLHTIAKGIAQESGALYSMVSSGDATRMCADISRAKRVLGWEPKVSLQEGLRAVLDAAQSKQPVLP